MPIVLTVNYRIDVPGPSLPTQQFSLSLRTEVAHPTEVEIHCARFQAVLQSNLNRAVPGKRCIGNVAYSSLADHGTCCQPTQGTWRLFANCSLDRRFIEGEAQARFGKPVACLDEVQARELIRLLCE